MNDFKFFTLLKRLEPGETASARLLNWDGKDYVPDSRIIKVHDHLGHYGLAGERGNCVLSSESGNWEVVSGLTRQATELRL